MTGRRDQPFNWLHDVAVPAVWGATEATWASLCVAAIADSGDGPVRIRLPYAAFVLPVVVAAVAASLISRLPWPRWRRWALLAGAAIVGGALTAGLVAGWSVPGALGRTAVVPWTVGGGAAATAAATGWWVAALAWTRGIWLGWQDAGFVHVIRSVGVGAAAFVLILLARAGHGQPAFNAATRPAGALLILFVCGAATLVALVRESDLEKEILDRPAPGASLSWLAVLAVPVAALAVLAVVVAFVVGPVAPVIGRALLHGGRDVWSVIAAAGSAVAGLFPSHHAPPRTQAPRQLPGAPRPLNLVKAPLAYLALAAAAVGLVSIAWSARRMRPSLGPWLRLPRWKPAAQPAAPGQRSTFGRPHPLRALGGALRRLLTRLRGGGPGVEVAVADAARSDTDQPPVRREYRRVLTAAAGQDLARGTAETAHELELRLASRVGGAGRDLHRLTRLYAEVRYGGRPPDVEDRETAAAAAAEVIAGLLAPEGDAGRVPGV